MLGCLAVYWDGAVDATLIKMQQEQKIVFYRKIELLKYCDSVGY